MQFLSTCWLLDNLDFPLALIMKFYPILFQDVPECLEYFHEGMVPKWGASTPNVAHLCQRFHNR